MPLNTQCDLLLTALGSLGGALDFLAPHRHDVLVEWISGVLGNCGLGVKGDNQARQSRFRPRLGESGVRRGGVYKMAMVP
jgi:hypothetical protein